MTEIFFLFISNINKTENNPQDCWKEMIKEAFGVAGLKTNLYEVGSQF